MSAPGSRRSPEPETATATATATRAAAALWILLALLAAARAVLSFTPGMAAWGMNVMRFLPPGIAWGTWILMALPLVPAVGRRLAGALPASGSNSRVVWLPWLAAGAAVLLVFLLPDRTMYVGDFLLRQGAVRNIMREDTVFLQALPLDRMLHHYLPRTLLDRALVDGQLTARLIGAVNAGALAWTAAMLSRVLGLTGAPGLAASAIVFFGGHLVLFTGYGKAVVELGMLTVAVGVAALRVLRTGQGVLALGVLLALAFPLHRSSVALLPAALFTWMVWLRDPRTRDTRRHPASLVGLALPWASLALVAPRIARTFLAVDVPVHLAPAGVVAGGVWSSAFGGLRLLDFLNLVVMLAPLAPLAIAASVTARAIPSARRELALLLVLTLPGLVLLPFLHPAQGLFRDWDTAITLGMALSLLSAWAIALTLQHAPRVAWLGVAAALGSAVPAVQWMAIHADAGRGAERVAAFVAGPPVRTEAERALALDFLGLRHMRMRQGPEAAAYFREAVALSPSPRLHMQWAMAETEAGNLLGALDVYARLIERTPDDPAAWRGYTATAARAEQWREAKRGATRLLELSPRERDARDLLAEIEARGLAPEPASLSKGAGHP